MIRVLRYETSPQAVQESPGPKIFLMGPTVRGHQPHLTSWRSTAIDEFNEQGFEGTLVVPEFTDRLASDKDRYDIPLWEFNGLISSDCIMVWLPRTKELIGLCTNFEFGYWMAREPNKMIYGRPNDAYRINYVDEMWQADYCSKHTGWTGLEQNIPDQYKPALKEFRPIYNTLESTIEAAIEKATYRWADKYLED